MRFEKDGAVKRLNLLKRPQDILEVAFLPYLLCTSEVISIYMWVFHVFWLGNTRQNILLFFLNFQFSFLVWNRLDYMNSAISWPGCWNLHHFDGSD